MATLARNFGKVVIMRVSLTRQDFGRILLAAILPLYMRSANSVLIAMLAAVTATSLSAHLGTRNIRFDLVLTIGVAASWSFFAAQFADYVLVGEVPRVVLTYAVAFDGIIGLLPTSLTPNIESEFIAVRSCEDPSTFLIPFMYAAVVSSWFAPYYNAGSGGKLVSCTAIIFVCCVGMAQKRAALRLWATRQVEGPSKDTIRQTDVEDVSEDCCIDREVERTTAEGVKRTTVRGEGQSTAKGAQTPTGTSKQEKSTSTAIADSNLEPPPPPIPAIMVTDVDVSALPVCVKTWPIEKPATAKNISNRVVPYYDQNKLFPVDERKKRQTKVRRNDRERKLRNEQREKDRQMANDISTMLQEEVRLEKKKEAPWTKL